MKNSLLIFFALSRIFTLRFRPYRFFSHTNHPRKPVRSFSHFLPFSFSPFHPFSLSHCLIVSLSPFLIFSLSFSSHAQFCIPQTTGYCCGFGITKVTFNTINNTSTNGSAGYQNFTAIQTTVFIGNSYSLYVKTDVPDKHNVKAWIDWNNDSIFDDVNEVVLDANAVLTCSTNVTIPTNAALNVPLRLRVSADFYTQPVPTPCSNLTYGQAEDYNVLVQQSITPPNAAFTADNIITCSGTVQFTDNSSNQPVVWYWDFGDSTSSTQQNPSHTYSASGTYTVTLIATNSFGSDTLVKNNYITVNLAAQLTPAACSPITTAYCCNYGIYIVNFNTISNTTANGIDSYQDYSCTKNTTVTEGMIYAINVTTGPDNPEDLRVWIDLNNDGWLSDTTEKVFTSINAKVHSGNITIPAATAYNVPLRMRLTSESSGNTITSCSNPLFGQTEDYGITIQQFNGAPTADFTSNSSSACDSTISFTDLSFGLPITWLWDFGDGTTSTQQNPTHTYTAAGTYTITLIITNQNSSDTIVKTNYITYNPGPKPAGCMPQTNMYCCGMGIYSVQFNTINNSTNDGADGYRDYSCQAQTILATNQTYSVTIITDSVYDENVRIWIDFNNNGTLGASGELVFSSDNQIMYHTGSIFIPGNAVTGKPLRMRVSSDYATSAAPLPCANLDYGQAEDYAVTIYTATAAPVSDFKVDSTNTCKGTVNFTDLSVNTPVSWLWNFGDGNTSTQKNPQHTYINDGVYTVSLKVTNPVGNNTKTKNNYVTKNISFCGVGIDEAKLNDGIEIYPNPNDGKFVVQITNHYRFTDYRLQIYNVLGEEIAMSNSRNEGRFNPLPSGGLGWALDLSHQPKGIYFLNIYSDEKNYSRKIVVE